MYIYDVCQHFNGKTYWQEWRNITVGPASDGYSLQLTGRDKNSTLKSYFTVLGINDHINMKFSTYDRDQDKSNSHCAKNLKTLVGGTKIASE